MHEYEMNRISDYLKIRSTFYTGASLNSSALGVYRAPKPALGTSSLEFNAITTETSIKSNITQYHRLKKHFGYYPAQF